MSEHEPMIGGTSCRSTGIPLACACGWHSHHPYKTKMAAQLDFGRHLLDPSYGYVPPEERCR